MIPALNWFLIRQQTFKLSLFAYWSILESSYRSSCDPVVLTARPAYGSLRGFLSSGISGRLSEKWNDAGETYRGHAEVSALEFRFSSKLEHPLVESKRQIVSNRAPLKEAAYQGDFNF